MPLPKPDLSIFHLVIARVRGAHTRGQVRGRKRGIERLKDLSLSSCTYSLPPRRAHAGRAPGRAYHEPNSPKPNGGEADGVRYFPGGDARLGPREQPRLATEFVSPVRGRGGRAAGLVRRPAKDATWANVGGPVANGRRWIASLRLPGARSSMFRKRLPKACDLLPESREFSVDLSERHNNEFTKRPTGVESVGDDVLKSKSTFVVPIREFPPRASGLLRHTIGIGSHAITLHDAWGWLPHRTRCQDRAIVKRGRQVVECAFSRSSHSSSPSDRGACVSTSGPHMSARPN